MKKVFLILMIFFSSILCSCSSYRDLDKLIFVTSILLDVDNQGHPVLYFETFVPIRSSSEAEPVEKRLIFKFKEKPFSEAINDINSSSGSRVTLSHNKIILFTKKAAEYGLENFMDITNRGQELNVRTLIAIYKGNPEKFVKLQYKGEKLVGLFLYNLIQNSEEFTSKGVNIDVKEFFNQRYIGDKVNSLPIITIKSVDSEDIFQVMGIGLIRNFKFIGEIPMDQTIFFNFLLNNPGIGILKINNPLDTTKFVAVRILNYDIKSDLNYDGNILYIKKTIKINSTFREAQGIMKFNEPIIKKIEKGLEAEVKKNSLELFKEYRAKNIDIFDIQEEFERKYPHSKDKYIISNTQLKIDAKVRIEGSPDIFDYN